MCTAGAGPIRVKEKQVFTWLDSDTLKIVSRPMVQVRCKLLLKCRDQHQHAFDSFLIADPLLRATQPYIIWQFGLELCRTGLF
jgi:hypothetical protein